MSEFEQAIIGLRIDVIPDFLLDHTLLGETPGERLVEHCNRWTQLISGLWHPKEVDACFSIYYHFDPVLPLIQSVVFVRGGTNNQSVALANALAQALFGFDIPVTNAEQVNYDLLSPQLHDGSTVFEIRQRDERVLTNTLHGKPSWEYQVTPWWGPGGPFLTPFRAMVGQKHPVSMHMVLRPKEQSDEEKAQLAQMASMGKSAATRPVHFDSEKKIVDYQSDPQAEWMGQLYAANLRRLSTPFLCACYCYSPDFIAGRTVAESVAAMINEEVPFETPLGESTPLKSRAEVVIQSQTESKQTLQTISQLRFQGSAQSEANDPSEQRFRYLVDARGAATVFRLPVSVRGGIQGLSVEQRPPDFHPGPVQRGIPTDHMYLGTLHSGGIATIPVDDLTKHILITGFTGSGKTQTLLGILHQAWNRFEIPFLVVESAKREYRGMIKVRDWTSREELRVYTLGDETTVPFRLNPFELLPGVRLETHIGRLLTCFEAALPQFGILPSLIAEAIEQIYRQYGWKLTDCGPPREEPAAFPRMLDLYKAIDGVVERRNYRGEMATNIPAAAKGRIKPLLMGSKGRMFGANRSIPCDQLFGHPSILELNDLNEQDKSLVSMFLMVLLREYRETNASEGHLVHLTVVEEAHNILSRVTSRNGGNETGTDTKAKAVEAFCNMLAEVRAYGEGLIIADQSPEKLAPDALRNTNLQISHQLRDGQDREAVSNAMIMTDEQRDFLGKLKPGKAAVFYTGLEKATFVDVLHFSKSDSGAGFDSVSDDELRKHMAIQPSSKPDPTCTGCTISCNFEPELEIACADAEQNMFAATSFKALRAGSLTRDDKLDKLALLAIRACKVAGISVNVDFSWCYLTRAFVDLAGGSGLNASVKPHFVKAICYQLQNAGSSEQHERSR